MLQALLNLSRLPEWREVDKLLEAELTVTTEKLLNSADPSATGKYQGRAKLLVELRQLVLDAPDMLVKLRAMPRAQHTPSPPRP